jgi:2-methylcitrate dehydratase PrpD
VIGDASARPSLALAQAAAATRWADTPDEVRVRTLDLLLDVLAVAAYGGTHPDFQSLPARWITGQGRATAIGRREGVPGTTAALLNGAATTVHQLQEGHRLARGHPASHVVPAALAVAEEASASSERLLSALIAGYEVAARIGVALGGMQSDLHDAGTWGTIGAAVAAAHVLVGPDAARLAQAIEGAAAVTLFPYRETAAAGASLHHLYIGLGASTGVAVAQAVAAGLSAVAGTLDGFFGPRAGAGFDPGQLVAGIDTHGRWRRYELLDGYIKVHPTVAHLHGVNDAVEEVLGEGPLDPAAVERVDVWIYGQALAFSNAAPTTDLAARFSIPYTVAAALAHGGLRVDSLSPASLEDARIVGLARRVHVHHDPGLDQLYPAGRPARVRVTLASGAVRQREVVHPRGDAARPLSREEHRAKVRALLARRFGASGAQAVVDAADGLGHGSSLTALSAALRAPSRVA